jgi:hypothetical protein
VSHTRAYAYASALRAEDLRDTLISVLESFYYACDALEIEAPRVGRPLDDASDLQAAIECLRQEAKGAWEARDKAERDAAEAEDQLADAKKEDPDGLRAKLAAVEAERDAALERVEKVRGLVEAHADLVAGARKFVSASIGAGVPLKHARAVPRAKRAQG